MTKIGPSGQEADDRYLAKSPVWQIGKLRTDLRSPTSNEVVKKIGVHPPRRQRRIKRWEHKAILERLQKCLDDDASKIPLQSKTVEHPFGRIKRWMGTIQFKIKFREKAVLKPTD